MKFKPFLLAGFLVCPLLASCAKPPYTVTERKVAGPLDIEVRISADVPMSATKAEMEGWCAEIMQGEDENKMIIVEFLQESLRSNQKGLCVDGKVYSVYK